MKLSIIIPVYHEEKNIEKVIKQLSLKVKTPHETLIVYDTKKDPTYAVAKKILPKYKLVKLVENKIGNKRGVINAIKTGIQKAKGSALVIVMADLSDDLKIIDPMISLTEKGYDIVCGSRYMKQGKKIGGPFFKTLLSKIAGLTLFYFFQIPTHDATNAFKMYKKNIFETIHIKSTGGFEYSLEIIIKAHKLGYRITEIPSIWKDREAGKSNFKLFRWLPKYIMTYALIFKHIEK
ncbi:MAG TPA: glycosyltransferase [Candidatus Acidoferrales bacterium]|nr:glycosyltransferase [Candidatus Acidoferrales bacterium]